MTFDRLSEISADLISEVKQFPFVRTKLFAALEPPGQNVVILKGARGIGKSTVIRQFLLAKEKQGHRVLYLSADSTLLDTGLAELAHEYQKRGGVYLAFDEIHKSPNWQAEVKTVLDAFSGLKLLVSGSSSTRLDYAASDLSRRHVMLSAKGLSLREYIEKMYHLTLDVYPLKTILTNPSDITRDIVSTLRKKQLDLLKIFKDYLRDGYFLSRDNYSNKNLYHHELLSKINQVIDSELSYTYPDINTPSSKHNIRALLKSIIKKSPFTPNISALSKNTGIRNDNTLKKYLFYLNEGEILTNLYSADKSHKDFQRPQKIFLNNTNYTYAHASNPLIGTVRETFAANCLRDQGSLTAPTFGDFCLNGEWVFEIGGRSKNKRQIKSIKQSYVLADDILSVEHGNLPLWLLGFLW